MHNDRLIDARPQIPAGQDSAWARAEDVRDSFADQMQNALAQQGVSALVSRSQPGAYPIAVSLISWTPEGESDSSILTRREEMSISIAVNPYLEQPLTYRIHVSTRRKTWNCERWRVSEKDVAALALFTLGLGPKPSILGGDFLRTIVLMIPGLNLLVERNELIESAKPKILTYPTALVWGGVGAIYVGMSGGSYMFGPIGLLLLPVGLVLIAIGTTWAARRPQVFSIVKRPERAPRSLFLLDSWHTSLPDSAVHFDALVTRIERALSNLDGAIVIAWERHQYRGPYQFEERDRLTLTKGQAVTHIHIYPFANDVFVGWDGFLNWAKWTETGAVSNTIENGKRIEFRSLDVAGYVPTDFDLVDFNALTELVHRRMVLEMKAFLKEKQIEADIDFSIIRGNRGEALDADRGGRGQIKPASNWRNPTLTA